MNLTDVDDRTIKAARAAGTTLRRHTEPFVRAFFEDRDYLRLRPAHVHPRATESVPAMIVLRSEEHTSELQSRSDLVCRLLLEQRHTASYGLCFIHQLPTKNI